MHPFMHELNFKNNHSGSRPESQQPQYSYVIDQELGLVTKGMKKNISLIPGNITFVKFLPENNTAWDCIYFTTLASDI